MILRSLRPAGKLKNKVDLKSGGWITSQSGVISIKKGHFRGYEMGCSKAMV
jgi:hypothetical protein